MLPKTSIQRAALLACVAGVPGFLASLWTTAQRIFAIEPSRQLWWAFPALGLMGLFTAILPLFCFALYRNPAPLRFSKPLRMTALIAAIVMSVLEVAPWIGSLEPASVLSEGPRLQITLASLPGMLADLTLVILLVTIFRQKPHDSDERAPVSKLLKTVTSVAVVAWAIWLAICIVRLAGVFYTYPALRDYASQTGQTVPSLAVLMASTGRELGAQACLFVLPYVVWRSLALTAAAGNGYPPSPPAEASADGTPVATPPEP